MWYIEDDPYYAPAESPIEITRVFSICIDLVAEILGVTAQNAEKIVQADFQKLFSNENLQNIAVLWILRKKFDSGSFIERNPTISGESIEEFCFRFRSEVALVLYPEKLERMRRFLMKKGITSWRPNILMMPLSQWWDKWLVKWIWENCRKADGKPDWVRFSIELNKIYPNTLEYREKRSTFTTDFCIETCRQIADRLVKKNGYWNPNMLAEIDGEVYNRLISFPQFRRPSARPDLVSRSEKTGIQFDIKKQNGRPNWFAISNMMWDTYIESMQLWNRIWEKHEQELRSFKYACEELEITVSHILESKPSWMPHHIQSENQALYRWFQSHLSIKWDGMKINWTTILEHSSRDTQVSFRKQL